MPATEPSPYEHLLQARELLSALLLTSASLAERLQEQADLLRIDALYAIGLRGTPRVDPLLPIAVASPAPSERLPLTIEALAGIWLRPEQNPKETLRVPGAIALPTALLALIAHGNQLRHQLFGHLQPLDQETRTSLWRSQPGIASLQVLRQTPILQAPAKLRFYWDTGASIERKRVADLMADYQARLQQRFGYRPDLRHEPGPATERKLAYALDLLERLDPEEQVAIWRRVSPHVRARVHDGEEPAYICSAPVPFVYDSRLPPPAIKPLASYHPQDAQLRGRSSRAQLEVEPYIDALNIYRYAEPYRQFGALTPRRLPRNQRKQAGAPDLAVQLPAAPPLPSDWRD